MPAGNKLTLRYAASLHHRGLGTTHAGTKVLSSSPRATVASHNHTRASSCQPHHRSRPQTTGATNKHALGRGQAQSEPKDETHVYPMTSTHHTVELRGFDPSTNRLDDERVALPRAIAPDPLAGYKFQGRRRQKSQGATGRRLAAGPAASHRSGSARVRPGARRDRVLVIDLQHHRAGTPQSRRARGIFPVV